MALWVFAIEAGLEVGLWALNKWVLDDSRKLPKSRPEGIEFAQASIGDPIPYVAGTIRVDNGVMAWHGNHNSNPVGAIPGLFIYFVDFVIAAGVPMWDEASAPWSSWRSTSPPQLRRLWYGDKPYEFFPKLSHGGQQVAIIDLSGDGQLSGFIQFFDGRADQSLSGTLTGNRFLAAGISASLVPGYRHKLLVCGAQVAIGRNPRMASIGVEVRALGPDSIGGTEANPAWVLYDILCRPVFGLGYDVDDVDLPSFEAAAAALVSEDHGCSVVVQQAQDAPTVFRALLSQIDGIIAENPATGKLYLKLIRNDYVFDDLLEINEDNCMAQGLQVDIIGWRDTINEVNVKFNNRAREYKPDSRTAQRLGNSAARSFRTRTLDFDAPGCATPELAARIAAREINVHSRPLTVIRCRVNREFFSVLVGDAVRVNLPRVSVVDRVFRVLEVDLGQLAEDAIRLSLVEDVFDSVKGQFPSNPEDTTVITLPPLTARLLTEAPWYLQYSAFVDGLVSSLTDQRILSCAVAEGQANVLRRNTASAGFGAALSSSLADQGPDSFVTTAVLAVAYPAVAGPYDTTEGVVVEDVSGQFASSFAALSGGSTCVLAMLGEEILGFESVTDLGAGQYRLVNVWRELLDTAPVDHAVGERLYLARTFDVGRRAWPVGFSLRGYAIPSYGAILGSGGVDGSDDIEVRGRALLPPRAADLRGAGYDLEGTAGTPTNVQTFPLLGDFREVTRLDGGLDVTGRQRARETPAVVRGDATGYTAEAGTTWSVYGQKIDADGGDPVAITGFEALSAPSAIGVLIGQVGHGDIDVLMRSSRGGLDNWQDARMRVTAPHWRNLLVNDSLEYGDLDPGWAVIAGTADVATGTQSLSRRSDGAWIEAVTAASGATNVRQTVDVSGYRPIGLTALVTWYSREFNGGAPDWSNAILTALDDTGSTLATSTSSNITAASTHWRRADHALALPADTASVRLEIVLTRFGEDGPTPSEIGTTRHRLQIGQFSSELLTNPAFDTGTGSAFTGWTNVDDNFVENTTNVGVSRNGTAPRSAQGGPFATSEIAQSVAIPAGYEHGVAVLTFARATEIADDIGEVQLVVEDVSLSVLATATTGSETTSPTAQWFRRTLYVQLPDGAAYLNVRLLAERAAGSGNSGAAFDDFSLRIFKDQDPALDIDLNFGQPIWQPAPDSWQRFHLQYPALPIPFAVWNGSDEAPVVQPTYRLSGPLHAWSDALTHAAAQFVGYWDVGPNRLLVGADLERVLSTSAYQFVRTAAGSAVDLQTTGAADDGDEYGNFDLSEPFTVAILFRTDEPVPSGLGIACGLIGRRDDSGIGWGIRIDAAGKLEVALQGDSSSASATGDVAVTDRAPHWAVLVNDPVASMLRLYDDLGSASASSTSGIGDITSVNTPLRIGRDGPASQTGGNQIARAMLWNVALSAGEVGELMSLGGDPSGELTAWDGSKAAWVHGPDGTAGATLIRCSASHIPVGHHADRGYGLVTSPGGSNRISSHDFTNGAKWEAETDVTLTHGVVDPTGLPRGITVTTESADVAIRNLDIVMGTNGTVSAVFYARTQDSVTSYDLAIELRDTDDLTIDIATVQITSIWQRCAVTLEGWVGSTPNAYIRIALGDGAVGSFDLAHAMWLDITEDVPFLIWDAATTHSGTSARRDGDLELQANFEGEIYADGVLSTSTPPVDQSIVAAEVDGGTPGSRALYTGSAGAPKFTLTDDSDTATTQTAMALDWSQPWTLRGRWNTLALPESGSNQIGLVSLGNVESSDYDPLAFDVGATTLNEIWIGGDPAIGAPPNAIISRVRIRSRDPKLDSIP